MIFKMRDGLRTISHIAITMNCELKKGLTKPLLEGLTMRPER